jgi:hypothetical protein
VQALVVILPVLILPHQTLVARSYIAFFIIVLYHEGLPSWAMYGSSFVPEAAPEENL